jgi:hypothetical protein
MIFGSFFAKAFNFHDYCAIEKNCTMEFSTEQIIKISNYSLNTISLSFDFSESSPNNHEDHACPVHGNHGCASSGAIDRPSNFGWNNLILVNVFLEILDSVKASPFLPKPVEPPRT